MGSVKFAMYCLPMSSAVKKLTGHVQCDMWPYYKAQLRREARRGRGEDR